MAILKGLGLRIAKIFGVEPKEEDETLEQKINKALAQERERIVITREDSDLFGWITKDNNPIHGSPDGTKEAAIKAGFKDTPIRGAHTASYAEQYVRRVVENMREFWGADIKIIGQHTSFKAPVYPGERILWQIESFKDAGDAIMLYATGNVKRTEENDLIKNVKVVDVTSRLGTNYKKSAEVEGAGRFSRTYSIEEDHISKFCKCVGVEVDGKVPDMLPAAFVPATLLALIEEKTNSMGGMNLYMDFDFASGAGAGGLQVDVFPPKRARSQKDEASGNTYYLYKFRALCRQGDKIVTYGELLCSTEHNIDFSGNP